VKQLCATAELSRASYYRSRRTPLPAPATMALRDRIQKIALQFPAYGYRRITQELQRRGHTVNHKRILRLMRNDVHLLTESNYSTRRGGRDA
jgi:putative transposase